MASSTSAHFKLAMSSVFYPESPFPRQQFETRQLAFDINACLSRGSRQLKDGDYKGALASFDRVLNLQPNTAAVWHQRGQALVNLECYTTAIASFDRALALQPDQPDTWVFRGIALIHLGQHTEALSNCEMALQLQPQLQLAWLFRGVALRYLHRYKAAYASYDRALGVRRVTAWQWFWNLLRQTWHSLQHQPCR